MNIDFGADFCSKIFVSQLDIAFITYTEAIADS